MKKSGGKLIVITGQDGCGKKTQSQLLVGKLKKSGYNVETIDFPQYENNFFGKMVGRYLSGEFGDPAKINPYLVSNLYAGDRWESLPQIEYWMNNDKIIVSDRYVGDNFLHQGSKIKDKVKREAFFQWLYYLEFNVFNARQADITFYLDVPLEISLRLLKNKEAKEKKDYIGGKEDGHENEKHLRETREISEDLIKKFGWIKIGCAEKGDILPKNEISDMLFKHVIDKEGFLELLFQ